MTTSEPTNDEIESVIEQLDGGQWDVSDWDYSSGMYDTPTLELELEYNPVAPDTDRGDVLDAIERIESNHDKGAPEDVVLEEIDAGRGVLEELKQLGEVYEPRDGHLRRT